MIKAAFKEERALTEALALQVVAQRGIMLCAIQRPRSRALPAREVEAPADIRLEQIFALAKIGDIFGNKPACFSDERSKLAQHLKANRVLAVYFRVFRRPVNARVEVLPIHVQGDKPGQVVDARAAIAHALER